jgi:hypothetical protein
MELVLGIVAILAGAYVVFLLTNNLLSRATGTPTYRDVGTYLSVQSSLGGGPTPGAGEPGRGGKPRFRDYSSGRVPRSDRAAAPVRTRAILSAPTGDRS